MNISNLDYFLNIQIHQYTKNEEKKDKQGQTYRPKH